MTKHRMYHVSVAQGFLMALPDDQLAGFLGIGSADKVRQELMLRAIEGRTNYVLQHCDNVLPDGQCGGHDVVQDLGGALTAADSQSAGREPV